MPDSQEVYANFTGYVNEGANPFCCKYHLAIMCLLATTRMVSMSMINCKTFVDIAIANLS